MPKASRRRAATASLRALAQSRGTDAKDPTARLAGRRARAAGRQFEAAIDAVNAWYDRHGEAAVLKINPPVEGWGTTLRVGASTVDYVGTWIVGTYTGDRRGIAFDAKCITGAATFGAPSASAGEGRARVRFFAQVDYLRTLRDRHGYETGFLLYCAELETCWWCGAHFLDELARGGSVPVRTRCRATREREEAIVHHLPRLVAPLERAAVPQPGTGRPLLDYLTLIARNPRFISC